MKKKQRRGKRECKAAKPHALPVQRSQNQHCAVFKLPVEILSEIFSWIILWRASPEAHYTTTAYSWLAVSWVCHHWRKVALSHSHLWSAITFSIHRIRPQLVNLFLERNTSSPIILSFHLSGNNHFPDALPLLHKHLGRITQLDIQGADEASLAEHSHTFKQSALQSLSIRCYHPCVVDDAPFVDNIANLTSLSLSSCMFPWSSPMYSSRLTTLEIRALCELELPSLTRIMRLLQKLPVLVNLTLEGAMKNSTRTPTQDVTLHHLRHLSVHATETICVTFFKHVHLPALDTLHVGYNPGSTRTSRNAVPKVLELAASILPSHSPFTELHLFLDDTFDCWGGFSLGTDAKVVTKVKTTPQEYYGEREMSHQALLKLSTKVTPWVEHINFLEFSGSTISPTIRMLQDSLFAWEKLTDFPSLRTIRMKHYRIPALLEAMYEHAMECIGIGFETSPRPGAPITQLIPKLETIEFEDFEFEPKILDIIHGVGLIDLLMAYLWAVKKHTGSCPRVVFKKCCGVNVHWLKELRSFTEVEWDGSGVDLDPLEKWYSSFSPDIPEFTFEGHIEWYKSINLWG